MENSESRQILFPSSMTSIFGTLGFCFRSYVILFLADIEPALGL